MNQEPVITVGLVQNVESVSIHLLTGYSDSGGRSFSPGEYRFTCKGSTITCAGGINGDFDEIFLTGTSPDSRFRVEITIGIDFHWQQNKEHTFSGSLHLVSEQDNHLTVINELPLESYILSVSCSEMNAQSPGEFLKAHSIISRSWLLAQLAAKSGSPPESVPPPETSGRIIRWYDRQTHTGFDVCADDHCQRYQGSDMITSGNVARAVEATRGEVLMYDGKPCDARFSKCCGGVTEDFRLAWGETRHPYLVPLCDCDEGTMPFPPLSVEHAARDFVTGSPEAWCNCSDESILSRILNSYDRTTGDFFRWQVRLTPGEIAGLLTTKLSLDLGRITALEPVERGLSARLKRLRIKGDRSSVIIGKELEIRRALSPTHLYSSAFVVDIEGDAGRPDAFILHGAGWGHGVGLCQIGAAVMACRGIGYREILQHYYPGTTLERLYS